MLCITLKEKEAGRLNASGSGARETNSQVLLDLFLHRLMCRNPLLQFTGEPIYKLGRLDDLCEPSDQEFSMGKFM